jgi:hypothetical protein
MIPRAVHHFFMRVMVWNMRWMTRYVGFIAHPIVRIYGNNEIIACGLRDANDNVAIIYTPRTGHREHGVVLRKGRRWVTAPSKTAKNFSGSVVRCLEMPGAENGALYRMVGAKASGSRLSSPTITVKPSTVYDPALLDIRP